ncbi:unnamed protein product [Rodentolepis nana]|uniref:N-acetyltransferase domain-containing protein n=1 Tax=Rodentolepis nana TaxID=102285 RepID=A0A0R3TXU4_RODNA|nr:unnamed protein product [Rodentolepis nana]
MIRQAKEQDCHGLYNLSIELLRNHENQGENTWISFENFQGLIKEGFVKFYVIIEENVESADGGYEFEQRPAKSRSVVVEEKADGYVAFMDDYDVYFGGPGILVDQFYVKEECRGKGYGKKLLNEVYKQALAQDAKYIKLFFQEREDRNIIYKRLGYKNYSSSAPFHRLLEIYRPCNIRQILGLDVFDDFNRTRKKTKHSRIQISQYKEGDYNYIVKHLKLLSDLENKENCQFPSPDLVVVAKYPSEPHPPSEQSTKLYVKKLLGPEWMGVNGDPWVIQTEISEISKARDSTLQICGFVERPSICCWLGHKLTFSNFVGDLSLINKDLIVGRVRYWNPEWGPILAVDFEVSADEGEPTAENNVLVRTLKSLGPIDEDKWNCAILEEKQIRSNLVKETR